MPSRTTCAFESPGERNAPRGILLCAGLISCASLTLLRRTNGSPSSHGNAMETTASSLGNQRTPTNQPSCSPKLRSTNAWPSSTESTAPPGIVSMVRTWGTSCASRRRNERTGLHSRNSQPGVPDRTVSSTPEIITAPMLLRMTSYCVNRVSSPERTRPPAGQSALNQRRPFIRRHSLNIG